jgi:hypothetical protein
MQAGSSLRTSSQLGSIERQQLEEFCELTGIFDPIESVVLGSSLWQIKVASRVGDDLVWSRLTDPALSANRGLYREFFLMLQRLAEVGYPIDFGEIKVGDISHIVIKRPFYRAILSGAPLSNLVDRQSLVRRICSAVRELHSFGISHGHLVPDNIAFDMGRVYLLDVGVCAFSPSIRMQKNDMAPEVQQGYPASLPADIYGLVSLIYSLLDVRELEPRQRSCLEKMESEDPTKRPTLEWVVEVFDPAPKIITRPHNTAGSQALDHHQIKESVRSKRSSLDDQGQTSSSWLPSLATLLVAGVLGVVGVQYWYELGVFRHPEAYPRYWRSGKNEDVMKVVYAALRGDYDAQRVVVDCANKGVRVAEVDDRILRLGFDPRWERELADTDREMLFKFAFSELVDSEPVVEDWESSIHPGVVYALAASSTLSPQVKSLFDDVPVLQLGLLPDELGESFRILAGLKKEVVTDPVVLGWISITTGQYSRQAFEAFLFSGDLTNDVALFTKTNMLVNRLLGQKEILEGVYFIIRSKPSSLEKLLGWFSQQDLELWGDKDHIVQLELLVKGIPKEVINPLQLLDLVLFPRKSIRDEAAARIAGLLVPLDRRPGFASFLAGPAQSLSRGQIVSIFSVFLNKSETDNVEPIRNWFKTQPNPLAVAHLIIARSIAMSNDKIKDLDVFDVEAAMYLNALGDQVKLPIELVRQLIVHPEAQVRALAYQNIDPRDDNQLRLLNEMLGLEPNVRLRSVIQKRIETFSGLS